jgi:peptidoglycan/LPS O-acetylase OafA/YrhL
MPLLCAVAFVNFAFVAWDGPRFTTLVSFAMRAFLTGSGLFSLHLPGYLSNSMGAWSLGIEIFFYVVFPLIFLIANSVSVRALVVTAITAILSQQTIMLLLQRWATEDPLRFWHYYTTPLTFALFFTLGILIYRSNGLRTRRNLIWSLCAGAAIMSFSLFVNVNIFISNTSYLGLTAIAFCAVFFAYRSELPGFLIAPATFLGNISYALYLTHPFSLIIARTIASSLQLGPAFRDIMYLMIAVTLAWCSFVLFERPARNFLRDLYAPTSMEPTAQRLAPPI